MADPDAAFGALEDLEQRGCAHAALNSRTEAAVSRTPAPRIREGVADSPVPTAGRDHSDHGVVPGGAGKDNQVEALRPLPVAAGSVNSATIDVRQEAGRLLVRILL